MRYAYDLSIVVPGIRQENWPRLYEEIKQACKRYTYEVIIVGPQPPQPELLADHNCKYVKDLGTPTRAIHMGTLVSEGKFFTWLADDGWVIPDSLDRSLDLLLANDPAKDIITIRYSEGTGHSGQEPPPEYWTAWYHPDLRLPGVDKSWKICCVMMLSSAYYRELGGLDCGFEHCNMNVHDLAFRAQKNGSRIHLSPTLVMNCDWDASRTPENSPVIAAYYENDKPLFDKLYSAPGRSIRIDPETWRNAEVAWHRRHKR